ncbi:tRNA 2'-phosphotransferase 1 [Gossypium hirsutum]|uniref:tRNA 2'-phosphotransferase 1 n=1 Tax=Gossypium hirsutum TaxID=3635 RepID=A0ABM2ZT50_GOSHI|nr:tRNA 2'-phosphotransferase 1-like [Gossypium hirsutum]
MFGNDFPVYPSPREQSAADGAQKQKLDDADKKIAVFFFHNSIPFSAAKSMEEADELCGTWEEKEDSSCTTSEISNLDSWSPKCWCINNHGKENAVRKDNKQRFSLLEENGEFLIRANQGHTVMTVESERLLKQILSADEVQFCVHGTYKRNLESILESGLKRMKRLHVHFSSGLPTDGEVISGMRRDVNVLIYLDVRKALEEGMKLYISDNKVILT